MPVGTVPQIATPPNATGHTSFTQHGTVTKIATPPAGSVGPVSATDTIIADHEARIAALEGAP